MALTSCEGKGRVRASWSVNPVVPVIHEMPENLVAPDPVESLTTFDYYPSHHESALSSQYPDEHRDTMKLGCGSNQQCRGLPFLWGQN